MNCSTFRPLAAAASLFIVMGLVTSPSLRAADHLEAPIVAQDLGADIADVYFFLDPNDNNFAVMAITAHGFITPNQNANTGFFDNNVRFRFQIENTGGASGDMSIFVTHSKQVSRTVPQTATIEVTRIGTALPQGRTFTAPTTLSRTAFGPQGPPTFGGGTQAEQTPTVTTDPQTNISYFGGLVDDPFFFDLGAELAYRNSRFANMTNPAILTRGRDSFAGYNAMAVALRVPVALLKGSAGDVIGLSGFAQRRQSSKLDPTKPMKDKTTGPWINVDRMAVPAVNTVLVPFARKDAYNRAIPPDDKAGKFAGDIVATLKALQTDDTSIGILANIAVVNGDILRLNTSIPNTGAEGGKNPEAAFPNGRRLNDDVIDTLLTLINNRVPQGDAVNDNEYPFKNEFPFFAQPSMPFPPGADDVTRN